MGISGILLFLHNGTPFPVHFARHFVIPDNRKVLSHLAEKEKIGGAAHGDTSPHHHTTYHFGLEVFAVIVADSAHLGSDVVYIQNHFHHTYLLIINSWVDFCFDFWLANVIYCES